MREIGNLLLEYNIKPSNPRLHIYSYLDKYRNHPTVEDIYLEVIESIPTLSKTTVYNTLDLFEEKELVKSLNVDNIEKHYELIIEDHSHFYCEKCDNIFDIPYKDINFLPSGYENFKIKEKNIILKGICPECR